jgi:LPXTG-site transpeptidase (sortase) family protein
MAKKTKYFIDLSKFRAHIFIGVGLLLMGIWVNNWWNQNDAERLSRTSLLKYQLTELMTLDKPHPIHIFIQWFVDAPISDGTLIGNTWTLSDTAAVYLIQSARPNTPGNSIIYGHNTREMMGNIRALKGYETITLTLSDGTKKDYKIKEMRQVTPESVSYILPTDHEVLTLFTCAGFADKDRFVVRAWPIDSTISKR